MASLLIIGGLAKRRHHGKRTRQRAIIGQAGESIFRFADQSTWLEKLRCRAGHHSAQCLDERRVECPLEQERRPWGKEDPQKPECPSDRHAGEHRG